MATDSAYEIREVGESNELKLQAAKILMTAFGELGSAWPDMRSAIDEVEDCVDNLNICLGLCDGERLLGWVGLRPMYEKTWELHPLVVAQKAPNNHHTPERAPGYGDCVRNLYGMRFRL